MDEDEFIARLSNESIEDVKRIRAQLEIAMTTLGQIATTPRNKGARHNAAATLAFLKYCGPDVSISAPENVEAK